MKIKTTKSYFIEGQVIKAGTDVNIKEENKFTLKPIEDAKYVKIINLKSEELPKKFNFVEEKIEYLYQFDKGDYKGKEMTYKEIIYSSSYAETPRGSTVQFNGKTYFILEEYGYHYGGIHGLQEVTLFAVFDENGNWYISDENWHTL